MSTTAAISEQIDQHESVATPSDAERRRERRRWIALAVLCLGQLMMVLDATIVNVALPSIQGDLHFSQSEPDLGDKRLPDHLRRLPAAGGTLRRSDRPQEGLPQRAGAVHGGLDACAACADSQAMLIGARLIQGVGGAVASSVILAIIVTEFPRRAEQAKAMGMYAFVSAGRRLDRAARRRRAHAVAQLALDLLRERADRPDRRLAARLAADRGERGHRPRRWSGRARLGADHARDDARRLRDREVKRLRICSRRVRSAPARASLALLAVVPGLGGAGRQPDHAAARPAAAHADGIEPDPRDC